VTGLGCVTRIYTESAVFELGGDAVVVRSTHGVSFEELQQRLPVSLVKA
jgi:3-oxoadipate CoA-transferase beta subunit